MSSDEAPLCLPPAVLERPLRVTLPTGTVDGHFHVFAPGAPLAVPRSYTPQILKIADWLAYADVLGIARGVLVQPSVYGFDNSVLLAALQELPGRLRGVAVISPETSDVALAQLHSSGIRGVRINTRNKSGLPLDSVVSFAHRLAPLGWSLHFQVNPNQLRDIAEFAPDLGLPIVIDHLGFIAFGTPPAEKHLGDLERLLDTGGCYVKISAPYRLDRSAGRTAFGAAARRMAATHPERLLWGSDWPHTELWDVAPDDAELIEQAHDWLGNHDARRFAFAANANRLFWAA